MRRFVIAPLRTGLVWATGLLATAVSAVIVIAIASRNPASPRINQVMHGWSKAWLRAGGVRLQIEGGGSLDPKQGYIVVSNHRSNFDIMANILAVPLPIRFLAKKELFKIPLLGWAMRSIGMVEVDRVRGSAVHRQLNEQAGRVLEQARSVVVYAEGTRSRDGNLQPFKKGAFAIAIEAGLPILPVTFHGSRRAWPPEGLVRGGVITAIVGDPIDTTGMSREDLPALLQRTREAIVAAWDEKERVASQA